MSVDTLERRGEMLRLHGLEFDVLCQVIDENLGEGIKATQYANTKMMNALRDDFRDYRTEFTTFRTYVDTRLDGIDTRLDGIDGRLDGIDTRLDGIDGRLDGMSGDIKEILRRLPAKE